MLDISHYCVKLGDILREKFNSFNKHIFIVCVIFILSLVSVWYLIEKGLYWYSNFFLGKD